MNSTDDLQALVDLHASRTGQPAAAWSRALAPLPGLVLLGHLSWDDARRLADSAAEPAHLQDILLDWAGDDDRAEGTPWDRLAAAVDHSNYGLSSWLETYAGLSAWLTAHNRTASYRRKLGYLVCTSELASRSPIRLPLIEVLGDMLDEFGFAED